MDNSLVFLDIETTHLDHRVGDVTEAAWAVELRPVRRVVFPHTLDGADPEALRIQRYYDRGLDLYCHVAGYTPDLHVPPVMLDFIRDLTGATIVAENYGFDIGYLLHKLGFEPWHYRKIELSTYAMSVFGLGRPEGQSKTAQRLRDCGFDIPEGDHSAVADVECLRACFCALRELRDRIMQPAGVLG